MRGEDILMFCYKKNDLYIWSAIKISRNALDDGKKLISKRFTSNVSR